MLFNNIDNPYYEEYNGFLGNSNIDSVCLYDGRINKEEIVFSIVIPTYKRNQFLTETLFSAIEQKCTFNYEIVVVDNNDDFNDNTTIELIKKINSDKIIYYKNKQNLGMFGNWNRCIELANSEWLLILHDDDTINSDYLNVMMSNINKYPDTACFGCLHRLIDDKGKAIEAPFNIKKIVNNIFKGKVSSISIRDFYFSHPINIMGVCLNKKKSIEIGGFDLNWDPISDYIFLANMARKYSAKLVNAELLNYRVAVNASLKMRNIIGIFELDAILRKQINQEFKFLSCKKDINFRSIYSFFYYNELMKGWGENLALPEINAIQEEHASFCKEMNYTRVSFLNIIRLKFMRYVYNFYIKYLR